MDSYDKLIYFHLPGIFKFFNGYVALIQQIVENPDIVKDNARIGSIYGSPRCIWNGGRLVYLDFDKTSLVNIKNYMDRHGIPVRFTFTNCLLEEQHTQDTYGNMLLEIFNTGNNEIICNSEALENHVRQNYGDSYRYISSTTKRILDHDLVHDELEKDYHLVVLDYVHNKDLDLLQHIEDKSKCEILCNAICMPHCPKRMEHYQFISKAQLESDHNHTFKCAGSTPHFWEVKKSNPCFISAEDINNTYIPMGFENFKLEGRTTHPMDWIEIILYYLIKEEYKDEVRNKLQLIDFY